MGKTSSIFSSDLPWAGLVAIAIILILEWGVADSRSSIASSRQLQNRILSSKLDQLPAADILILGDSSASTSIDADFLTRSGGPSFYNLGMVGSVGTCGNYLLLERYLRVQPKPRAVLIMFAPETLNYPNDVFAAVDNLVRYFHQASEIAVYAPYLGHEAALQALSYALVPNRGWTDFFRGFPRGDLAGWADVQRQVQENFRFWQQCQAHRGFTPVTEHKPFEARAVELHMTPFQSDCLERLLDRLRKLEVDTYFALSPLPETVYRASDPRTFEHFYAELARKGVKRLPTPDWLPDDQFGTSVHLTEEHTRLFNERLAPALAKLTARK